MREIKFRSWIAKHKLMVYSDHSDICRTGPNEFEISPFVVEIPVNDPSIGTEELEWQQYIGLKDKNGKDIYEGDLISTYKKTKKIFWEVKFGTWIVGKDDYETDEHEVYGWYMEKIGEQTSIYGEVVGNIYENPELLTHKPI